MKDKYFVDLHIHSCLSPCADEDMNPYNIVAMAKLKGLDAIAITDHNSALNLPAAKKAAAFFDVELIAGIEITSKEEVHMLAYFREVAQALEAGEWIYSHLPKEKNRGDIFGNQLIIDTNYEIAGEEERLLIGATDLSIEEIGEGIVQLGGIYVPAHINRGAYSLLKQFAFIPPTIPFPILEVVKELAIKESLLEEAMILHSSDAHYLGDISEADFFLEGTGVDVFSILSTIFMERR
ncbi:MAG: PHP domain-containing protein [Clostridiales bacterium]|nr:PHP domain-containing protein [Clostridiales bacterium]